MTPLTIFTIPRAFQGRYVTAQCNAIGSWLRLNPTPEVVLYGNDLIVGEAAASLGCRQVPELAASIHGTPLVSNAFLQEQSYTDGTLAYVNTDIVLFQDFVDAVEKVKSRFAQYLVIGRRTDLDFTTEIDFTQNWQSRLRTVVAQRGRLHAVTGIDYFVFESGLFPTIPPFAIAYCWDNWLVDDALTRQIPVVDATESILAVHQDHPKRSHSGLDCEANRKLHGYRTNVGQISYATWILDEKGLRRRK